MIKKILVGAILAAFITSCFAGYSSGGRSGFSGGSRGSSSSRSYSTFSSGRTGYSRSGTSVRSYVAPRSYSRSYSGTSSNTVIHNNNYSHGGLGYGGSSFFSGFLGGYLGGAMAHPHSQVVVAGGGMVPAPVIEQGQGMLMEPHYVSSGYGFMYALFLIISIFALIIFAIYAWVKFYDSAPRCNHHNRW